MHTLSPDCSPTSASETQGSKSPSASPAVRSPAKHKAKFDADVEDEEAKDTSLGNLLGAFPTTDQTVSQTFLKDMMLSLRSSIQQSFTSALNSQKSIIDDLDERVDHVESKMVDFSVAHNGLVDAHNQLDDNLKLLSAKLVDLEDRNRRNNIKLRGIPESVSNSELTPNSSNK